MSRIRRCGRSAGPLDVIASIDGLEHLTKDLAGKPLAGFLVLSGHGWRYGLPIIG